MTLVRVLLWNLNQEVVFSVAASLTRWTSACVSVGPPSSSRVNSAAVVEERPSGGGEGKKSEETGPTGKNKKKQTTL